MTSPPDASKPLQPPTDQQQHFTSNTSLSDEDKALLLILEAEDRHRRTVPPGLYTGLAHLLITDNELRAWIVDSARGAPPVRQKYTTLIHELALHHLYGELYEQTLDLEAHATHHYIDQLAARACQMARMKEKERRERKVASHVGAERRHLEGSETAVRVTLQDSYAQQVRLLAREMLAKRSLLSSTEYQTQVRRVTLHADNILQSVMKSLEVQP